MAASASISATLTRSSLALSANSFSSAVIFSLVVEGVEVFLRQSCPFLALHP